MFPRPPPHPWLGIKNCQEAKTNKRGLCVICCPPHPHPRRRSKFRSVGKDIEKMLVERFFMSLMKKLKIVTKTIGGSGGQRRLVRSRTHLHPAFSTARVRVLVK